MLKMQNAAIELFYLFFQGVLTFQILVFGVLFFITRRKDLLYYSLFLFFAAAYFFINAPYTFFGIPEDTVWNSAWYDFTNTPLIIIENLFYLLFLNSFFADITSDKIVNRVLRFTLWLVPFIVLLFVLFTVLQMDKQFIFYSVKLIAVTPAMVVSYILFKRKPPFAILVVNGLLCTIAGTCITVFMIILRNRGVHHLFTDGYPLFFIRLGLLGDMIFYLAAILKKWHFQEKQLVIEKFQSQLAVEKLRNKISGELHDDIGSTLSGISMYSHLAKNQVVSGEKEKVEQSLQVIQQSANEMVSKLQDIVWSVNPQEDSLEQMIVRIKEYAAGMTNGNNMKLRLEIQKQFTSVNLTMENRRNIYLLCKEAINNAVKYSGASLLEIKILTDNRVMEFIIKDNGNGFDIKNVKRGNGLDNMQRRADEIGAKLVLQSKQNEGTSVLLQCKIG